MNVSGVLVHALPELVEVVALRLTACAGVEVHASTQDGRLVVTVEDEESLMFDTINSFHDIDGVLSISLIYHEFDNPLVLEKETKQTGGLSWG